MDTRKIAVEYRMAHWTQIVQDRSNSGLSIKAYCENTGIHEYAYYYWLKKLREATCEGLSAMQSSVRRSSSESPVFAEVKLPTSTTLPPPLMNSQTQICIETAGVRLTAGDQYPTEKLTELLKVVMKPC